MKKRGLAFGLLPILLLKFINALPYQSYNNFSFGNLLQNLDPSLVISSILFVLFFAVIFFSTSRIFENNKATSAVVSISLSIGIIYGLNFTIDLIA